MKILVSGAFYANVASAQWRNPLFESIAQAITDLGHEVHTFNPGDFTDNPKSWQKLLERLVTIPTRLLGIPKRKVKHWFPWSAISQQERGLLSAVEMHQPDLLLVMAYVHFRPEVLKSCRRLGVKHLTGWHLEGPLHEIQPASVCSHFDNFYCIHQCFPPEFNSKISILPTLFRNDHSFRDLGIPTKNGSIVFVGGLTQRRVEYLKAIASMPIKIWGPGGWDRVPELAHAFQGEFIWGDDLNDLYNHASIVLNISSWAPELSGVTQRIADVPLSGALLMTDMTDELEKWFRVNQEILTFSTPDDLRLQCKRYLSDITARNAIANAGRQRAMQLPTVTALATALISQT